MNKVKDTTTLATVAFVLHIIWENAQAPLYAGYQSFSKHFPMCFVGAIGDVVITLSVLVFLWLLKKDIVRPADFLGLAIIGFIVATAIEQNALLAGKWNYASAMPIIPLLNVGLAPIVQMTILLPLSFYVAGLFNKNHSMVKIIKSQSKEWYQCEECGLMYESKEIAEKCQAWCSEHKSCNLDIITNAVKDSEEKVEN